MKVKKEGPILSAGFERLCFGSCFIPSNTALGTKLRELLTLKGELRLHVLAAMTFRVSILKIEVLGLADPEELQR